MAWLAQTMTDLADFLLARIAEDEAAAFGTATIGYALRPTDTGIVTVVGGARLRAECEAKRRIVRQATWAGPRATLRDRVFGSAADEAYQQGVKAAIRLLALPYADHPDYRESWRPS